VHLFCQHCSAAENHVLQVHNKIRNEPIHEKKLRAKPADQKIWQPRKLSYEQRKENLKAKLATLME